MLRVHGPAIAADFQAMAKTVLTPDVGQLSGLLAAVVAVEAEALQLTQPEQVHIATMRLDVIGNARWLDQAVCGAHPAERLLCELSLGDLLPPRLLVPRVPKRFGTY